VFKFTFWVKQSQEIVNATPTKDDYLKVKQYDKAGQRLIAALVAEATEVKDHPADLINVAIEELVKRYELPAFSTLDRLIRHIRSIVNRLFALCSKGFLSMSRFI